MTHFDINQQKHWIFDLDNVLYPADSGVFDQMDLKMGQFIERFLGLPSVKARKLQKDYFHKCGTTLSGLMQENNVDPYIFLEFVHDIDMRALTIDTELRTMIKALPGEALIFTNADRPYAERVLKARGLDGIFSHIQDIHDAQYRPKPYAFAYEKLIKDTNIDPVHSIFVDDMAKNLMEANRIGIKTVWLDNGRYWGDESRNNDTIDLRITNLKSWLQKIVSQL